MNDPIESLLRQMPLKKPPASLDARVLGAIRAKTDAAGGQAAPRRRGARPWVLGILGGCLAAAAALVLAWGLWPPGGAGTSGPTAPEGVAGSPASSGPVRVEQNWSQVSYDGLVFPDERTPWQKFRRQTVERVQWIDDAHGIRMESTAPREDILLIAAPLY